MMSVAQPMKAYVIDKSLNKSIAMSYYYLLPPVNQDQLTYLFSFDNFNDRVWLTNEKLNTNYITSS